MIQEHPRWIVLIPDVCTANPLLDNQEVIAISNAATMLNLTLQQATQRLEEILDNL